MSKLQVWDSLETHQDGLNSEMNSFQQKVCQNSTMVQRNDRGMMTQGMKCNCDCDVVVKLKQKAHRSFMQVIEIQGLYKEEIEEVKRFYQESIRNNDRKYKIKQEMMNQKCRMLENQVLRVKEYYEKIKSQEIGDVLESPFELSNFDSILQCFQNDDSCSSIVNIKEFVRMPKLKQNSAFLKKQIDSLILGLKSVIKPWGNLCDELNGCIVPLENEIMRIFIFVDEMIENVVNAYQKYNDLIINFTENQNRNSKVYGILEANQKEARLMSEHIKRLSQEKIKMQKKQIELQRMNRGLLQNVEELKKSLIENFKNNQKNGMNMKRDEEIYKSLKVLDEDQDNGLKGNLFMSLRNKKVFVKLSQGNGVQRMVPRSLNFKKKQKIEKIAK